MLSRTKIKRDSIKNHDNFTEFSGRSFQYPYDGQRDVDNNLNPDCNFCNNINFKCNYYTEQQFDANVNDVNRPSPRSMRSQGKRPGCGSRQACRPRRRFRRIGLYRDVWIAAIAAIA